MSPAVLSLTVCFVSLVYGIYQSGHFTYKGQVPFSNIQSTIKEMSVPNYVNDAVYCGLQCAREPKCLAIEICTREDRQLCRLCNYTNPSFTKNKTDTCSHLQLGYQRDITDMYSKVLHSCKDLLSNSNYGMVSSGVYSINVDGKPTEVWCDMVTEGGGWTVIQRRQNGITDFYRSWSEYKKGFGNASGEYWIGNDALHTLTTRRNVTLRVDLEQFNGAKGYGTWNTFRVDNETNNYTLSLSGLNGFNGNLKIHACISDNNGDSFTTYDRDNGDWYGGNCAVYHHGGWWYGRCTLSNLNGRYHTFPTESITSVFCHYWTNNAPTSLKTTTMMIR